MPNKNKDFLLVGWHTHFYRNFYCFNENAASRLRIFIIKYKSKYGHLAFKNIFLHTHRPSYKNVSIIFDYRTAILLKVNF